MVNLRGSLHEYILWTNIKAKPEKHIRYCIGISIAVLSLRVVCLRNIRPYHEKGCPSCAYEIYPPISTAIIVLIRRGEEILLVHARNFAEHSMVW